MRDGPGAMPMGRYRGSRFRVAASARGGRAGQPGRVEVRNLPGIWGVASPSEFEEGKMGLGRGALLWLLGVPLPIIILLAIFWGN